MYFFRPNIDKLVSKQDLPRLQTLLGDRDIALRVEAARALGRLGFPDALPALIAALTDAEKGVRCEVAKALGHFQDAAAVRALVQALTDAEAHVRRQAVDALSAIGSAAIDPLITVLWQSDEEAVRQGAVQALGDIDEERAIEGLMLALRDKRGNVRATAVEKLERRKTAALPFLVRAIEEDDEVMQQRVLEVLTRLCRAPAGQGLVTEALICLLLQGHTQARQVLTPLISRMNVTDVTPLVFALSHAGAELRQWAYKLLEGFQWQPSDQEEEAVYRTVQAEVQGWRRQPQEHDDANEPEEQHEEKQYVSHFQVVALAKRLNVAPKMARQLILQQLKQRGQATAVPAPAAAPVPAQPDTDVAATKDKATAEN